MKLSISVAGTTILKDFIYYTLESLSHSVLSEPIWLRNARIHYPSSVFTTKAITTNDKEVLLHWYILRVNWERLLLVYNGQQETTWCFWFKCIWPSSIMPLITVCWIVVLNINRKQQNIISLERLGQLVTKSETIVGLGSILRFDMRTTIAFRKPVKIHSQSL